jgi:hypothetical protein
MRNLIKIIEEFEPQLKKNHGSREDTSEHTLTFAQLSGQCQSNKPVNFNFLHQNSTDRSSMKIPISDIAMISLNDKNK